MQYLYDSGLSKRDTFAIGPLIAIPAGFLDCPTDGDAGECDVCQENDSNTDGDVKRKRNDLTGDEPTEPSTMLCPFCGPPSDASCSGSDLAERSDAIKTMTLPWTTKEDGDIFSFYTSCGSGGAGSVKKVSLT